MGYLNCKWCEGKGCLQCDIEEEKDLEASMQPIFTARYDNPEEMEAFKRIAGGDALNHAFGPGGGGMDEILRNAALHKLIAFNKPTHFSG